MRIRLLLVLLAPWLAGQSIQFENPAPSARRAWVQVSVPDALLTEPSYMVGPFTAVKGRRLGAGFSALHVNVSMNAFESVTYPLVSVSAPAVSGPEPAAEAIALPIRVIANGRAWEPTVELVSDSPAVLIKIAGRIPGTMLIAEMWVNYYLGEPVARWELLVVNSDPSSTELFQWVTDLRLEIDGELYIAPFWSRWRGATHNAHNSVTLLRETTVVDSQGIAFAGVVALSADPSTGAWLHGPICGVLDAASWQGHWGPFGAVPSFPRNEQAHVNRMISWYNRTQSVGDYWRAPLLGLAPNAGQTGGQDDFGASKLGWAWAGGALHTLEAYHSALHEACRPGQWYERDGSPVEPWLHTNFITWSGYIHWHNSYASDRLGKGLQPTPRFSGGYNGPDREHWSNNLLCGTYVLTGSPLLRRVIEKQARQFLSGETLDPRLPSTSGVGAARGIGRTLLAAAWIDQCLADGELRTRFRQRVMDRCSQKVEPFTRPPAGATVAPLATTEDPRRLGGVACWGWEEPLGLMGLRAAELWFGSAPAGVTLRRACASWIRSGWWHDGSGWKMADNVAYLSGQAPPVSAYPTITNPTPVFPPLVERIAGFEEWAQGSLIIAVEVLEGELQDKARTILATFPVTKVAEAEWRATR